MSERWAIKRRLVVGCWTTVGLALAAISILVFVRTRPVDVAHVPLPKQPADNSFFAIARLAEKSVEAATKSFALREGRRLLPDRGDDQLRADYLAAIADIREQYLPLIGKPYMPPKRFSIAEVPYSTDGVHYWSVAEAVILDDLLRAKQYDAAANQLLRTIGFSQQLASCGDLSASLIGGFMWLRAVAVVERHFESIPARHGALFSKTLQSGLALARPHSEAIDADEAAQIIFVKELHGSADLAWKAYFDYRQVARNTKANYDVLRAQMKLPIAQRRVPENTDSFEDIFFAGSLMIYGTEHPRVRSRMLLVAFAIRDYRARHNRYPERLDSLLLGEHIIDPYTGDELIYKVGPDGFLLYARGIDGDDDGGTRGSSYRNEGDVGVLAPKREELDAERMAAPLWLK